MISSLSNYYLTFEQDGPCPDPDFISICCNTQIFLIFDILYFISMMSLLYNLDILFVVFGFWQLINIIDTVDILPPNFVTLE